MDNKNTMIDERTKGICRKAPINDALFKDGKPMYYYFNCAGKIVARD